jgi:hypothetical protein
VGIAVVGSILTAVYRNDLSLAPRAARGAGAQGAVVGCRRGHLGPPIADDAHNAFVSGMHAGLLCAAAAAIVAAIGVVLLAHTPDPDDTAMGATTV